jgi:hypothetical protein
MTVAGSTQGEPAVSSTPENKEVLQKNQTSENTQGSFSRAVRAK